jgi:tripartite ATP-independent transporter DctP family solute receptor
MTAVVVLGSMSCSKSDSSPQVAAEKAKVYEITAALHTTAGGIEEKSVQAFGELLKERTDGSIVVKTFAGASLGTEQENLSQIKSGEIQFCVFGDVFTAQLLQKYNATAIPFVFPDIEAAEAYWNSVSAIVDKTILDNGNIKIVGRQRRAPRMLTANKAVHKPADLAGLKLRVPETPFFITVWSTLGAVVAPVNWSEIYTALQTHVVEAQENPIETYYTARLHEVQKYTMLTSHINTHYTWTVNNDFYNSLSPDYQKMLYECAAVTLDKVNKELFDRQADVVEKLKAAGHTFIEVDTNQFRNAAMSGILKCAESLAPEAQAAVKQYLK